MKWLAFTVVALVSPLIGHVLALPAWAIVRRHDVLDDQYTAAAGDPAFDAVGKFFWEHVGGTTIERYTASGTVIDPLWVLTAAHVGDGAPAGTVFIVGGTEYQILEWIWHPHWRTGSDFRMIGAAKEGWDIALARLETPVTGVPQAVRYAGSSEVGSVAMIVGYGATGTGEYGDRNPEGAKRAGANVIDVLGGSVSDWEWADRVLVMDFDNPDNADDSSFDPWEPLPLEGFPGAGDSGGGVFIDVDGTQQVAGVVSFASVGPVQDPDDHPNSDYGELCGAMGVSAINVWIDDNLGTCYWQETAGGEFSDPANWSNGEMASASEIGVFGVDGTYSVTFGADTSTRRVRVRRGNVTFDLGGCVYSLGTTSGSPSLVVAELDAEEASFAITDGLFLGHDATVAQSETTTGQITISGPTAECNLSGSFFIGGTNERRGGTGSVIVENGATLNVAGAIKLWWPGGRLELNGETATVGSIDLRGGVLTGTADLIVTGLSQTGPSQWNGGEMIGSGLTTFRSDATLEITHASLRGRTIDNEGAVILQGDGVFDFHG
ncbi:MAG: trypsin-like serine protease [Planctomycetota bacterium]